MSTRIHLLPERDRAMAETYRQPVDGSSNPTGEATPQTAPVTHHPPFTDVAEAKVVRPADETPAKPKPARSRATTKATRAKGTSAS